MIIGTLHPAPSYDFRKTIAAARFHTVLDVIRDGDCWRALRIGENLALVRVAQNSVALEVSLIHATGEVDPDTLLAKVSHMMGIDADMTPFYERARTDAILWGIVEPLYGLNHVRAETLFEALVTTIIEQQIALSLAQRGERWLVEWGNNAIEYHGERFYTFPRPEQIAAASLDDLKPLKITTRRMQVLIDVSQQIVSGAIDLEALRHKPAAEILERLVSFKGIGHWTAAWTIIRALGQYQYIGENDVALQAAVQHFFYQKAGKVAPQIVKETLGRYEPYAGAAAFYILMRWAMDRYG
jgi:DNA-3-methyladenine glycosylase II